MATQKHPFERGGPTRIQISWGGGWRNFVVRFDDEEVGTVNGGMRALKQGAQFTLSDGSKIDIKLVTGGWNSLPDLQVRRNGELLPGSGGDPEIKLKGAYQIVYFLGGINILAGVIAEIAHVDFLRALGIGWFSVIFGAVYLFLGYLIQQKSKTAVLIACGLLALDAILGLILYVPAGRTPPVGGLIMRVFFIIGIAQGWSAIDQLNALEQKAIESEVWFK